MSGQAAGARQRIALMTGGGDAPGLNAVIRAVVAAADRQGWDCIGIRDGFNGLLDPASCSGEPVMLLTPEATHGITHLGGTILGSTVHGDPFHYPVRAADGSVREADRSAELLALLAAQRVDALVAVGGDGTMAIAAALAECGLRVVGVPKTIDNDLDHTIATFGFDTAVGFATECIDRLHSTAHSHGRVMVVETMGRHAGWIALHAGLAAGAHAILIPELPFDPALVAAAVRTRFRHGRGHAIVVVAEGAAPAGGAAMLAEAGRAGAPARLGGIGAWLAWQLQEATGRDTREVVLGHLLRGGSPSAFDRVAALRFGAAAVRVLAAGQGGVMVALHEHGVGTVPLRAVAGRTRRVPVDGDTVLAARELGICLGDAVAPSGSST